MSTWICDCCGRCVDEVPCPHCDAVSVKLSCTTELEQAKRAARVEALQSLDNYEAEILKWRMYGDLSTVQTFRGWLWERWPDLARELAGKNGMYVESVCPCDGFVEPIAGMFERWLAKVKEAGSA